MDVALQAMYKETGKGICCAREGSSWNIERYEGDKGGQDANRERVHGRKVMARKEAQEQRKVTTATAGHAGLVQEQDTLQLRVHKAATRTCMPCVRRK